MSLQWIWRVGNHYEDGSFDWCTALRRVRSSLESQRPCGGHGGQGHGRGGTGDLEDDLKIFPGFQYRSSRTGVVSLFCGLT